MDMKKYRLVKLDEDYKPLELNGVYDGDLVPEGWRASIGKIADWFPDDWEEVHQDFQVDEIDGKKHYMIELKEGESLTVITNGSTTTISA